MAKTRSQAVQRRESVIYTAIASFCTKRAVRSDLQPGEEYAISAHLLGKVGSQPQVEADVNGILSVGHPSTRNTAVTVPTEQLIAALLDRIPAKSRPGILHSLAGQYAEAGAIEVSASAFEEAKMWLKTLRSFRSVATAGIVSFRVQA